MFLAISASDLVYWLGLESNSVGGVKTWQFSIWDVWVAGEKLLWSQQEQDWINQPDSYLNGKTKLQFY